jgi:TolB-like protein
MRYVMLLLLGGVICGCTSSTQYIHKYPYVAPLERNDGQFYDNVNRLAVQILRSRKGWNNDYIEYGMAMTSLVNLDDLSTTSDFGRQVSEGMFAAMVAKGVNVIEPRLAGQLTMEPKNGEFVLSREAQKLAAQMEVTFVLVGSYQQSHSGYHVNMRIVEVATQQVIAAGYRFFPADVVPVMPSVRYTNGGLVRDDISYQ